MEALDHFVGQLVFEDGDVFFLIRNAGLARLRILAAVPGALRRIRNEQTIRFGLRNEQMLAPDAIALAVIIIATATATEDTGARGHELIVHRIVRPRIVRDAEADALTHERIFAVHVLGIGPGGEVGLITPFHDRLEHALFVPIVDRRRRNLRIAFSELGLLLLSDLRVGALRCRIVAAREKRTATDQKRCDGLHFDSFSSGVIAGRYDRRSFVSSANAPRRGTNADSRAHRPCSCPRTRARSGHEASTSAHHRLRRPGRRDCSADRSNPCGRTSSARRPRDEPAPAWVRTPCT